MEENLGTSRNRVKGHPLVSLTSDFGLEDAYVGTMKGVILGICPAARLVDITHGLPPQDILAGCLALEAATPYFPRGSVHLAVVDPGVGTARAALAVRTADHLFVAPDNGLLSFLEQSAVLAARRIENPAVLLEPISATFHGRDVFAPAAAHLAAGFAIDDLGPAVVDFVRIPLPRPVRAACGIRGEVLAFDRFGTAMTSIRRTDLPAGALSAEAGGRSIPFVSTYADVAPGAPLALVGSSGRVELSVRNGSAKARLGLCRGAPVIVRP